MAIFYKSPFRKFVKKQTRVFQLVIEDEVEKIGDNPEIGGSKKGDLSGFKVHKFNFKKHRFLIAYCIKGDDIIFYMVGPHENFYRKLKQYSKEVK